VSALFRKVHTTRRFQEALHGYSQESTRTKFVSTWQDLEEQEDASRSTIQCSDACRYIVPGVPRKEERRSSPTRIPPIQFL
jgi:hypothetical protein